MKKLLWLVRFADGLLLLVTGLILISIHIHKGEPSFFDNLSSQKFSFYFAIQLLVFIVVSVILRKK